MCPHCSLDNIGTFDVSYFINHSLPLEASESSMCFVVRPLFWSDYEGLGAWCNRFLGSPRLQQKRKNTIFASVESNTGGTHVYLCWKQNRWQVTVFFLACSLLCLDLTTPLGHIPALPYLQVVYSKSSRGYLKPQLVPNPILNVFSYTNIPMIEFNFLFQV